jgi:hypothetical protein
VALVTVEIRFRAFNQAGLETHRAVKAWGDPIMVEQNDKVKCPLCEGRGDVLRSELVERITNPELRKRLDARIAEILEAGEMAGVSPKVRNFEKEVHTWNPTLPMWQRSPKE